MCRQIIATYLKMTPFCFTRSPSHKLCMSAKEKVMSPFAEEKSETFVRCYSCNRIAYVRELDKRIMGIRFHTFSAR